MKTLNDFSGSKMNKEVSGRYIQKGEYRDLRNGRVSNSDDSNVGVLQQIAGTTKLNGYDFDSTGYSGMVVIGSCCHEDKIYYIVTYNVEGQIPTASYIVEYDTKTDKSVIIIEDKIRYVNNKIDYYPQLNLNKSTKIHSMKVFQGMLIFCDYNHAEPYKINIERAKQGHYNSGGSMKLIKAPPIQPPKLSLILKDNNNLNYNFKNHSFQFAYRYHYVDGEISAISQRSEVAFKSLLGEEAVDSTQVIDVRLDDFGFVIENKDIAGSSVGTVRITTHPVPHGTRDDTKAFAFSCIRIDKNNYKGVILRQNNSNTLEVIEFNLDGTVTKRYSTGSLGGNYPHVVMCPKDPNIYYCSHVGFLPSNQLNVNNNNNQRVTNIGSNYAVEINQPLAISDNCQYVYVGYNDELAVSSNFGTSFTNTLHVDGNSTPSGTDIYSQAIVRAITCNSFGKIVYAMVVEKDVQKDFKIARSYDYGSTWEVSPNINIGAVEMRNADIETDETGSKVVVAYTLPDRIVFKTSTDGGKTFPTTNEYIKTIKYSSKVTSFFMTMSKDGNSLYIGYIDSANKGVIDKSTDDGSSFTNIKTTTGNTDVGKYAMATDIIKQPKYDNNFIQNDVSCVNINIDTSNLSPEVKEIEVIAIDVNTNIAYSVKKDVPLAVNVVHFCNDTTYKVIPTKDVNKLYDNVPHKARSFDIIQNSLIFGGYTDGYTSDTLFSTTIIPVYVTFDEAVAHSLKHGVTQSYAIIFYDDYNRSSDAIPLGSVNIGNLVGATTLDVYVELQIEGQAPDWATSYAIARKPALLDYDIINGFDSAHIYNGKLYLEYTSYKDIDVQQGSKIELMLEESSSGAYSVVATSFELKVNNIVEIVNNIVAADGSTVLLPNGRYIVTSPTDVTNYDSAVVVAKTSKYTTSVFYIHRPKTVRSDKVYFELPRRYTIVNRQLIGDSTLGNKTVIKLDYDFDVLISKKYPAEVYKLNENNIITNLGRPNLDSDNFRQIDRYASLCASEVYVDETNFNGLSSFNLSLINYTDLDKMDGDIRLIDSNDTNVEVYQRDKVSKVMYKKNILSMADSTQALSKTQDIWGEQVKYVSEFGLSHPESFAKWANDTYFVDANRGVVLRKTSNGIIPISMYGMINYFHDNLELYKYNVIRGYYEPEYNLYHVVLNNDNLSFSEKSNGWESICDLIPSNVINDDSNVYSFKDTALYKHNVGSLNNFYDTHYSLTVESYINDNPDIIKVFNAIIINGDKPSGATVEVENDKTTILGDMFEFKENTFSSYIPMGENLPSSEFFFLGKVSVDAVGTSANVTMNSVDRRLRVGYHVWKYDSSTNYSIGSRGYWGKITAINGNVITVSVPVHSTADTVLIAASNTPIDGFPLKGRYAKIKLIYNTTDAIKIDSFIVDIDKSNQ